MYLDFTEKTAKKRHNRRMAIAIASGVLAAVITTVEIIVLIKVGFL